MKHFLKVFCVAFICFSLAIGTAIFSFNKFYEPAIGQGLDSDDNLDGKLKEINDKADKDLTPLERAIKKSNRVNVLLLGIENQNLSDTMMLASYDPDTKKLDLISVPRDTYYHEEGYNDGGNRKLNSKHARKGPEGTKEAIEDILGIPIDNYVTVKYKGVEEIVDIIGGVEVDVPFHMKYQDPTDNPPLYIDIPKGKQKLNGEKAIQFLRYRKSNNGKQGYKDGDLGRIKMQQEFIKSAVKKAIGLKLPSVVKTSFKYVKTDMKLSEILGLIPEVIGFSTENISSTLLPGVPEYIRVNGVNLSFYKHDPAKVEELMMDLYKVEPNED